MAVENKTIARPYAEAVFDLAVQGDKLDPWSDMLSLLSQMVTDPQLARLIDSPDMGRARLQGLILEIAGTHLSAEGANLVKLLVENKRLTVLPEIAEHYEQLKHSRQGTIDVTITAAYAVNKTQEHKLAEALKKRLGRDVRISTEKDPSLIGGVKIRAGDLVIDGSIRNKLSRLATEFGI
jgi:F-type H+-transporting ATPase subunit delta